MTSRKLPDTLLRRRKANEHVRIQHEPALTTGGRRAHRHRCDRVRAALDVPSRRNVDGYDRQARMRDERECSVERCAHGGLKREAKDGVENDVACRERRRQRRLCQPRRARVGRRGERRDVHVCALRVQALRGKRRHNGMPIFSGEDTN